TAEWASTNSAAVTGFRKRLDQILLDAKGENSPAPATPVERNVSQGSDGQKEAVERSNFLAEMKAEADRILTETRAEAARILNETKDEARRILADSEKKADAI